MAARKRTEPVGQAPAGVVAGQSKQALPKVAPQKSKVSRIGNLGDWAHPAKKKK